MDARLHEQSTSHLRGLLQQGLSRLTRCPSGLWRFGPISATISSNSVALQEQLTRCLLPGGAGGDLTLGLLSGSAAPFEAPPPWNLPHSDQRHLERLHVAPDGSLTALFNPDFGSWLILDHERREGLMWIGDEALLPPWEQGSPFKTLINWLIAPSPLLMVHAGAVATAAGGCLLVGPGGSGKSTTVAACFERGLDVCGDDLVLVEEQAEGYRAWGLYDSVKLDPQGSVAPPPALQQANFVMCAGKRLVRYRDIEGRSLARRMDLRVVMRCVVARRPRTAIVAESPGAMLRALAPPTVFLLRGREEAALPKLGRLVRRLPCYRLELGTDPAEAADCLASWLDASRGAA